MEIPGDNRSHRTPFALGATTTKHLGSLFLLFLLRASIDEDIYETIAMNTPGLLV